MDEPAPTSSPDAPRGSPAELAPVVPGAPGAGPATRTAATRRRRLIGGGSGLVGLVLGGGAAYYVVRQLVDDWPAAEASLRGAAPGWIILAAVTALVAMVAMAWGWRGVLGLLGVDQPRHRVVAWYFVGELGKYLPGGVWPVLGRGELARRGGVPRSRAYASVALSLGMLYLAGLLVAVAFLPFALTGDGFTPWMLFLLALPVGLGLLHHVVLGRMVGLVTRLTGRRFDLPVPRWGDSLALVARYVPSWLLVGTATWAVARALTPDASFSRILFATVLSWVAGFLAVPVPAGAGVREAVLAASSGLDGGVAAATAIVARLLFVAADAVGAAVGAPIAGRARALVGTVDERRGPPGDDPPG
jgi:glycosyltransferase 2 family protein